MSLQGYTLHWGWGNMPHLLFKFQYLSPSLLLFRVNQISLSIVLLLSRNHSASERINGVVNMLIFSCEYLSYELFPHAHSGTYFILEFCFSDNIQTALTCWWRLLRQSVARKEYLQINCVTATGESASAKYMFCGEKPLL